MFLVSLTSLHVWVAMGRHVSKMPAASSPANRLAYEHRVLYAGLIVLALLPLFFWMCHAFASEYLIETWAMAAAIVASQLHAIGFYYLLTD